MIPILERYLKEEPFSLIQQYPRRVRLERKTTFMFLTEDLEILRVQSGSRRAASASIETATLREKTGDCVPKLIQHPEIPWEKTSCKRVKHIVLSQCCERTFRKEDPPSANGHAADEPRHRQSEQPSLSNTIRGHKSIGWSRRQDRLT